MSDYVRRLIEKSTLGPIPKPYKCLVCGETTLAHHRYQYEAQLCRKHYEEMREAQDTSEATEEREKP